MSRAARVTLLAALACAAGCYYELDPIELAPDQGVPDLGPDLAGIDLSDDGPRCPNGGLPFHAGELAEDPIDRWGAQPLDPANVASPTATVSLDPARVKVGAGSLRLDTNNVELAATKAPRPLLMASAKGDWTKETMQLEFPEMHNFYALIDSRDRVHAYQEHAHHNYNRQSREHVNPLMARCSTR